jgi:DNA-binding NtrC family response regulator
VNAGVGSPTALIVDDDVAFILWLGEMFTENGYQAIPALHCRQALTLVKRLALRVDVLVVNPKLRGAERAMKALASRQPSLRVVLIRDPSTSGPAPDSADSNRATLERPSAWEPISRAQWVTKIRKVLPRPSSVDARPNNRETT